MEIERKRVSEKKSTVEFVVAELVAEDGEDLVVGHLIQQRVVQDNLLARPEAHDEPRSTSIKSD